MRPMDKKRIATLAGTLVLAGAVVAAGVYGPSAWKVFRQQGSTDQNVVIQTPAVDSIGAPANSGANGSNGATELTPNGTAPPGTSGAAAAAQQATTLTPTPTSNTNTSSQGGTASKSKYREPDTKLIDLAPSVAAFFGDNALSNDAKTLVFGTAWNIHQYVDGYLYGPAAGPQLNEKDIERYILFHKTLLDKQFKNEANVSKAATFTSYLDVLLNSGIDAFNSKDKTRIEQFHQGIHDLDAHILRNDTNSKIYGATPFATKR